MYRNVRRPMAGIIIASMALTLAAGGGDDDSAEPAEEPAAETTVAEETAEESATETTMAEETGEESATETTMAEETGEESATETTAAEESAPDAEPLRIGFLPPTLGIDAFQGLWHGLEGAGGGMFGDTVQAIDANFDPAVQIQTIDQWVQLDEIDALWVIPVAAEALKPSLEAATDAGVVVIAGGKPADYGFEGEVPGITFSDIDNVAFGKGIGDLMAACVNDRLGGESDVIYVGPNSANESTTNINTSSQEALAEGAPDATIVQELVAASDLAGTQTMVETAIQGNPGTDGYMAGDAESTMAGLNAYTNAGMDATSICIVGNGGGDDQVAAVDAGELYGVVAFDFEGDLIQNLTELHTMAADPTAPGQLLTVPITVIGG